MKFKVNFSGFAYVEANNKNEVIEKYKYDDNDYRESGVDSVEEVDDFIIEL